MPMFALEVHAKWLMQQLRLMLKPQRHFESPSMDVVKRVAGLHVGHCLTKIRFDIKESYVVGDFLTVAYHVASLFAGGLRTLVHDVKLCLLSN